MTRQGSGTPRAVHAAPTTSRSTSAELTDMQRISRALGARRAAVMGDFVALMACSDLEAVPRPNLRRLREHLAAALRLMDQEWASLEHYCWATRSLADLARPTSRWDRLQVTRASIRASIQDLRGKRGRPSETKRRTVTLTLAVALRVHGVRVTSSKTSPFWQVLREVLPAYGCFAPSNVPDEVAMCTRYVNSTTAAQLRDAFYPCSAPWVRRLSRSPVN